MASLAMPLPLQVPLPVPLPVPASSALDITKHQMRVMIARWNYQQLQIPRLLETTRLQIQENQEWMEQVKQAIADAKTLCDELVSLSSPLSSR
jgi:hypothetical protein